MVGGAGGVTPVYGTSLCFRAGAPTLTFDKRATARLRLRRSPPPPPWNGGGCGGQGVLLLCTALLCASGPEHLIYRGGNC